MPIVRDWINPIMKNVPYGTRPNGYLGAIVMAAIAAINPKSYFTKPYIGAFCWLVMSWWSYNQNPLKLIRPPAERPSFISGNPRWYQTIKALLVGLLLNPIPMFFIYALMLVIVRLDARLL